LGVLPSVTDKTAAVYLAFVFLACGSDHSLVYRF
jgi:hypothetical protein